MQACSNASICPGRSTLPGVSLYEAKQRILSALILTRLVSSFGTETLAVFGSGPSADTLGVRRRRHLCAAARSSQSLMRRRIAAALVRCSVVITALSVSQFSALSEHCRQPARRAAHGAAKSNRHGLTARRLPLPKRLRA